MRANNPSPVNLLNKIRIEIENQSDSPYLDALVLLSYISGKHKSEILASPDPKLTSDQKSQLSSSIKKIKKGVPLPYVLGEWEFFGLLFKITPEVMIPRPESEWLVERGIHWLGENPDRRVFLDLGTGSGCLAVAVTKSILDLKTIAVDKSYPAILVAQENARGHQVQDRIQFITSDLLNGVHPRVDLIIANLPYIPSGKLRELPVYKTEPCQALDGGPDGLSYIRRFLLAAPAVVNPGGLILLELDEEAGKEALTLAEGSLPGSDIHLKQDLSGQDRYLELQFHG